MQGVLSGLYYYPVKSLQGVALEQAELDAFGIRWDRRFMLVDEQGRFVTQRQFPALSRFSASIRDSSVAILEIVAPNGERHLFELDEFIQPLMVSVWSSRCRALRCDSKRLDFLSTELGCPVDLVFMPDNEFRQVDRTWFDQTQRVSFADGFPCLLTNTASLDELNGRLQLAVPMGRFRPNVVVSVAQPYAEDAWHEIAIGNVRFAVVKPCSRCSMTTIDEQAKTGKEPLATLASYRRNDVGVCFGQNIVHLNQGVLSLSDPVRVLR